MPSVTLEQRKASVGTSVRIPFPLWVRMVHLAEKGAGLEVFNEMILTGLEKHVSDLEAKKTEKQK